MTLINQTNQKIVWFDINVNKDFIKCGKSLRFWENKRWINSIGPYGWFQWYFRYWLGRWLFDDERQIARWKVIVNRYKGKLVKTVKDVWSRFDDYSISSRIRQILLYWDYELVEDYLLWLIFLFM